MGSAHLRPVHRAWLTAMLSAMALVAAACGNARSSGPTAGAAAGSSGGSAPGVTATAINVGSLATASGPLASGFGEITAGVKAYFDMVNARGGVDGRRLVLAYQGDDQGSPSVDTDVARTLVTQDHVFAIVGVATPFFTASTYLTQQGTPAFGEVVSSSWDNAPNLFGAFGSYLDISSVGYEAAFVARQVHATAAAVVSYPIAQSAQACQSEITDLRAAGVSVPVTDLSFLPGGNVVPDVVQMKAHHVDLFVSCMEGPDNLSFARAMDQYGLAGFHALWLTGYSPRTVRDNPALTNNTVFLEQHVPFEAVAAFPGRYPGMATYLAAMKKYEPRWVKDDTAFQGWVNAAQFVAGLRAAGPHPTQQKLIAAINAERAFTAGGVMTPLDWHTDHTAAPPPYCVAYVEAHDGSLSPAFLLHRGQVFDCFGGKGQPVASPPGTPGT